MATAPSMKNFSCESFELTVEFDEKDFNKEEFLRMIYADSEQEPDLDVFKTGYFIAHCNSKGKRKRDHAHVEFKVREENSEIEMDVHPGKIEEGLEVAEIPIEDYFADMSQFFINQPSVVSILASFKFGDEYEPLIRLGYPLLIGSSILKEGTVTGHAIEFSPESPIDRLFITESSGTVSALLSSTVEIKMSEIEPYRIMEQFSDYAHGLFLKKGDGHDKNK